MSIFFGNDEPPIWLSLIGLTIIAIALIGEQLYEFLFFGIILLLIARQCYKWAVKINSNRYIAYFIGLFLSLLGLGLYYWYYRRKLKTLNHAVNDKNKTKAVKTETQSDKAKRAIKEYTESKTGEEDFDSPFIYEEGFRNYYSIYRRGKFGEEFECNRDSVIKEVLRMNFDVPKALENLIEDHEVKEEAKKIKERDRKLRIKEKAEIKVCGKFKTNRVAIKSEEKDAILRKFGNKCSICSRTEGLHIHHKDKNPSNNRMDNLIVLCGVCHKKIHMKVR